MFRFTIRDVLWLVIAVFALATPPLPAQSEDRKDILFPFQGVSGYGYMDRDGREIVASSFRRAADFRNGLGRVETTDGKTRFVDAQGNIAIELESRFSDVRDFNDDRAAICVNPRPARQLGKWGFVDQRGHVVIEAKYDDVRAFSEGMAAVNVGAGWEFGHPFDYRTGGKWGYVDRSGQLVIPIQYKHVDRRGFREGLALVANDNQDLLYIAPDGNTAFQLKLENARLFGPSTFCEGLVRVSIAADFHSTGFVDRTGKFVIEPRVDAGEFSEGLCAFRSEDLWGYMDKTGRAVIEPGFVEARKFSEGFAIVGVGEQFGFIDRKGQLVIAPQFNDAEAFRGGLARVHVGGSYVHARGSWQGGAWHYINGKGDKVHDCRSDDAPGAIGYGRENRK